MNSHFHIIFLPLLAYLSGAVPFGLIFTRWFAHTDVRQHGSGNIGATNVRRAAGTAAAAATLVCDALKGALPTGAALYAVGTGSAPQWIAAAAALAAICGHMFPIYLKLKPSGKGVATAMGAFALLTPLACAVAAATFLTAVAVSRRISVGSLAGALALPPTIWLTTQDSVVTTAGIIAMLLIVIRHKENIERLRQGKEPCLRNRH